MAVISANRNKNLVYIVDRDVAIVEALRQKLTSVGFETRAIGDVGQAITAIVENAPHLVIIDWNMPGLAALEVIQTVRKLRSRDRGRLIILSALSGEQDVVNGLNLGADDYIVKPFSVREVVARVSAVLRVLPRAEQRSVLTVDEVVLDLNNYQVTARGQSLSMRSVEFRLLEFLMLYAGRTFNRHQLLNQVWGADSTVDERTVDVNVQRLRKILARSGCESYIQTIRGFGYRFASPDRVG
ncbi:MAG: winged helix-turn-helix domain-containing protein [Gammaproteobacteria bacterium]|nr:winged helix-turn-helix domain-containing protein [Gammaproteobacteria bacterium]